MNESPTPYEIASMDDRTLVAMYFATSLEPEDPVVEALIAEMTNEASISDGATCKYYRPNSDALITWAKPAVRADPPEGPAGDPRRGQLQSLVYG